MLKLTLLCLLFVSLWAKTYPEKEKNPGGKTDHEKEKNTGGKSHPEKEKNTGGKTYPEKEKNHGGKTDPEKEMFTDSPLFREAIMRMNSLGGAYRDRDGCRARINCAPNELPQGSDIVSVRLYHETARDQTKLHTLLAEANDQSRMFFHDHVQLANAGTFRFENMGPVCPGMGYCVDTTTYLIYPVQEENLGEYMCETRVRRGKKMLLYVGRATLAFDRCCKACPYCIMQVFGVWDGFGYWSPEQCKGCVQVRRSNSCLTDSCTGPPPVQSRRCFQDGVCDETDLIKIHTERVKDRCRAKIQCTVIGYAKVTSVQLFHVWGPKKAVQFTGFTDVEYTGSILLAEATAGVNGGRFTEKVAHPNGGIDPKIPSDPQLCICADNCREYYTYTLDTVNPANVGDYACVVQPNGAAFGFDFAARLDFSDDCPRPIKETVREEECEEYCLETYMVEGHEKYIKHYCHKLCEVDEEVKESVWA